MGEHRADDDRYVTLQNQPIYPDVDDLPEHSIREFGHGVRAEGTHTSEGLRDPPLMVHDGELGIADHYGDRLPRHRRVRPQRDDGSAGTDTRTNGRRHRGQEQW